MIGLAQSTMCCRVRRGRGKKIRVSVYRAKRGNKEVKTEVNTDTQTHKNIGAYTLARALAHVRTHMSHAHNGARTRTHFCFPVYARTKVNKEVRAKMKTNTEENTEANTESIMETNTEAITEANTEAS